MAEQDKDVIQEKERISKEVLQGISPLVTSQLAGTGGISLTNNLQTLLQSLINFNSTINQLSQSLTKFDDVVTHNLELIREYNEGRAQQVNKEAYIERERIMEEKNAKTQLVSNREKAVPDADESIADIAKKLLKNPVIAAALAGLAYKMLPDDRKEQIKGFLKSFGDEIKNIIPEFSKVNTALKVAGAALLSFFGIKLIGSTAAALAGIVKLIGALARMPGRVARRFLSLPKLGKLALVTGAGAALYFSKPEDAEASIEAIKDKATGLIDEITSITSEKTAVDETAPSANIETPGAVPVTEPAVPVIKKVPSNEVNKAKKEAPSNTKKEVQKNIRTQRDTVKDQSIDRAPDVQRINAPAPSAGQPVIIPPRMIPSTPMFGQALKDRENIIKELQAAGITDVRSHANILAQVEKESGFTPQSEEIERYSAKRLFDLFGKGNIHGNRVRFNTVGEARAVVAEGPEAVAEIIYGGRLGNTEPGDAYRYRGRGYIQLTGKDAYKKVGDAIGVDLVSQPDLANDPQIAAKIIPAFLTLYKKVDVEKLSDIDVVNKAVGAADKVSIQQRKDLARDIETALAANIQPGEKIAVNVAQVEPQPDLSVPALATPLAPLSSTTQEKTQIGVDVKSSKSADSSVEVTPVKTLDREQVSAEGASPRAAPIAPLAASELSSKRPAPVPPVSSPASRVNVPPAAPKDSTSPVIVTQREAPTSSSKANPVAAAKVAMNKFVSEVESGDFAKSLQNAAAAGQKGIMQGWDSISRMIAGLSEDVSGAQSGPGPTTVNNTTSQTPIIGGETRADIAGPIPSPIADRGVLAFNVKHGTPSVPA